jgi:sec-independent protein translocase protein TatC
MPLDQDPTPDDSPLSGFMSLGGHLDELRGRLIKAIIVPLVIGCALFAGGNYVRGFLVQPLMEALAAQGQPTNLQVLSPTETLMVDLKVAIWASLTLSLPWVLFQLWKFVSPGLYAHERRYARLLVPLSVSLVVIGLTGLYLALPYMLALLISFGVEEPRTIAPPPSALVEGTPRIPVLDADPASAKPGEVWMLKQDSQLYVAIDTGREDGRMEVRTIATRTTGNLTQQYRLEEFIDFLLFFAAAIALAFQMPVAVLLLGWVGIIDTKMLRGYRKHAFFVCTIIAAVITPTVDMFSMLFLLVPLYLLYELGIILLTIAPPQAVSEGGVFRNALGTMIGRPKYKPKRTDGNEGDE